MLDTVIMTEFQGGLFRSIDMTPAKEWSDTGGCVVSQASGMVQFFEGLRQTAKPEASCCNASTYLWLREPCI